MEHAGKGEEQLSVGVKAYGNQAAAASNQFCCKLRRSQAGNIVITSTIGKVRQRSCYSFCCD